MHRTIHTTAGRALLTLVLSGMVTLTAAGCDADDRPVSSPTERQTTESSTGSSNDDRSDTAEVTDDNRFGIGLDKTAEIITDQVENATGYSIDGTTVTITVSDGSVDFDGALDCMSVRGLLNEGESLALSYPDGTTTC